MKPVNFFFSFVILFLFPVFAFASASISVPVSISYTGGCIMDTPPHDLGTISAIIPNTGAIVPNSAYNFQVTCTAGISYTVKMMGFPQDMVGATCGKEIRAAFFRNAGYSSEITGASSTITTGTGDDTTKNYTVYVKIYGFTATDSACTYLSPNYHCTEDTYSKNITFRVTY